jgi:hypothetical protein
VVCGCVPWRATVGWCVGVCHGVRTHLQYDSRVALGAGVQSVEEELDDARLGRPVAKRVPGRKMKKRLKERNGVRKRGECMCEKKGRKGTGRWREKGYGAVARERVRGGGERKWKKRCDVKNREKHVYVVSSVRKKKKKNGEKIDAVYSVGVVLMTSGFENSKSKCCQSCLMSPHFVPHIR